MFEKLRTLFAESDDGKAESHSAESEVAVAAAMLLLEVAWADHEITDVERRTIAEALTSSYAVSDHEVEDILQRSHEEHGHSTGIYPFTKRLNGVLDYEEKQALLVHLWRMIPFDGNEFHYEESVIRRIADLMYLRHSDFIAAKLQVKNELKPIDD